jgi:hypothetical protein
LLADWKRFICCNKELPRERSSLPLFVSTEKPLVPLILNMDLGFEEMLNWDQLEPTRKAKTWLKI